ncbi:uncharacterized protein [Oscarella lobularis]|uniref:uncharacterized protein n=1 Tax=Oscarella lobularis TaxID=121494 RepID=UPI0033131A7A
MAWELKTNANDDEVFSQRCTSKKQESIENSCSRLEKRCKYSTKQKGAIEGYIRQSERRKKNATKTKLSRIFTAPLPLATSTTAIRSLVFRHLAGSQFSVSVATTMTSFASAPSQKFRRRDHDDAREAVTFETD